jgi:hypothetical protein
MDYARADVNLGKSVSIPSINPAAYLGVLKPVAANNSRRRLGAPLAVRVQDQMEEFCGSLPTINPLPTG